jgi:hypothetical protein
MSTPVLKAELDNRSNQLNPRHPLYYRSRGLSEAAARALATQLSKGRGAPTCLPEGR